VGARLRQSLTAVVLVIMLLPLLAASALAAPPATDSWSFTQKGLSADAGESVCTTTGDLVTCTGRSVSIFSGHFREQGSGAIVGTQVCVSYYTDVWNETTGEPVSFTSEFGCTTDVGSATNIQRDVSSATIAATTVTLQSETCERVGDEFECTVGEETRDVVVEGTFTATSPTVRQSYRNFYDDGVCIFRDSFRGTSASAMFVGTIDGEAVEIGNDENGYSQIGNGTWSSSGRCSLES